MTIHEEIASDLKGLGGVLRCSECGRQETLDGMAGYFAHGWPTCCNGYALMWVTQRLLDKEGARS